MKLIRYILFPIVPIYFLVTWLRNKFYDFGIFESKEYELPIICVGNLSVGGTGKTPMIEYLIRFLKPKYCIATLSRGYKRSTKGFAIANKDATASTIGDEPYQFYTKFNNIIVSVDANRQNGISNLLGLKAPPEIILLDDAFQHRKVKAKFNILLTSYHDLYVKDILLPTGNLREPKSGSKRADIIVVTKCPESISESDKRHIKESLQPKINQQVFFSFIQYSNSIKNNFEEQDLNFLSNKKFTLVTGIAYSKPLVAYLKNKELDFEHLNYGDHHEFTSNEIQNLKMKEWILTTEKDFMRLSSHFNESRNLFYVPIEIQIDKPQQFNTLVESYLK